MNFNQEIEKLYSEIIPEKYGSEYEYNRWFSAGHKISDYRMMHYTINHLLPSSFKKCIEFGPGPGTWTRLLFRKEPTARFTLVDISETMREEFIREMRLVDTVNYIHSNVEEYEDTNQYDFIFSSRMIEYVEHKEKFLGMMYQLLQENGQVLLITKNPTPRKSSQQSWQHKKQISRAQLRAALALIGFNEIEFRTAIIRLPLKKLTWPLAEFLQKQLRNKILKDHSFFDIVIESYAVICRKR